MAEVEEVDAIVEHIVDGGYLYFEFDMAVAWVGTAAVFDDAFDFALVVVGDPDFVVGMIHFEFAGVEIKVVVKGY